MDREDWQIVSGVVLASVGVGWWCHPGFGLVVAGVSLVVPFFLPKKRKGE